MVASGEVEDATSNYYSGYHDSLLNICVTYYVSLSQSRLTSFVHELSLNTAKYRISNMSSTTGAL